jgi:hypothetical protein
MEGLSKIALPFFLDGNLTALVGKPGLHFVGLVQKGSGNSNVCFWV